MSKLPWGNLPAVSPAGEMVPYMAPRDREEMAKRIFIMAGGPQRMVTLLAEDTESGKARFFEFGKKFLLDRLPKPPVEIVRPEKGAEDFLEAIEAEFSVVSDGVDPEAGEG